MKTSAETALDRLDALRQELAAARARKDAVMGEMKTAMRAAQAAGASFEEIVRRSGVARQTVSDALPKTGSKRR